MGSNIFKQSLSEEEKMKKEDELLDEEEKRRYGEFDDIFAKHDYNGDETLGEKEFIDAVKSYIKTHEDKAHYMADLLDNFEITKGICITKEEFRRIMSIYIMDEISLETMIEVFKCFDKNLQGAIGAPQIKHVFGRLGLNVTDTEAEALIREADSDGSGAMDFEEFLKIMIAK